MHQPVEVSHVGNVKASSGSGRLSCHLAAQRDYKELRLLKQSGQWTNGAERQLWSLDLIP